jgi:hypothetical protein
MQYDCDFLANLSGAYATSSSPNNPCTCPGNLQSTSCTAANSGVPSGTYYTCASGMCVNTISSTTFLTVPLTQQVRNPVSAFATDNNGVIVELQEVPVGGAAAQETNGSVPTPVTGSLVFGIGTQSNNGLSGATVLAIDTAYNSHGPANPDWSGFYTVFNGAAYPTAADNQAIITAFGGPPGTFGSFIDSGSTDLLFLDQPTSRIPLCPSGAYYCPTAGSGQYQTEAFGAVNVDVNNNSRGVNFNISNGDMLINDTTNVAFSDLAQPATTGSSLSSLNEAEDAFFDWGLPFFYGRNVYTAIQGVTPPNGSVPAGPWWAY